MSSAKGTIASCGDGKWFSVKFTCTGPNCYVLDGYLGTTCTNTDSVLDCDNQWTCKEASTFTTDFSYDQDPVTGRVTQSQRINYHGKEIDIDSNGTTVGTTVEAGDDSSASSSSTISASTPEATYEAAATTDFESSQPTITWGGSLSSEFIGISATHTATTNTTHSPYNTATTSPSLIQVQTSNGKAFRRPYKPGFVFLFLLVATFFAQGSLGFVRHPLNGLFNSTQLYPRAPPASFEDWKAELEAGEAVEEWAWDMFKDKTGEYYGDVVLKALNSEPLFAQHLLDQIGNTACNMVVYSALDATALDGIMKDLVETCTAVIETLAIENPVLEFWATVAAGSTCFAAVNSLLPWLGDAVKSACDTIKEELGACGEDLLEDANNCGECGVVCSSGVCVNGACADTSCAGQSVGLIPCGADLTCQCGLSLDGSPVCLNDNLDCGDLTDSCVADIDCRSGWLCADSQKCDTKRCIWADCGETPVPASTTTLNEPPASMTSELAAQTTSIEESTETTSDDSGFPAPTTTEDDSATSSTTISSSEPTDTPSKHTGGWAIVVSEYNWYETSESDYLNSNNLLETINGVLTINTQCVNISPDQGGFLPGSGDAIPQGTDVQVFVADGMEPDTCCLAYWDQAGCAGTRVDVCTESEFPAPTQILSWQVYGCQGIWGQTEDHLFR